MTDKEIIKALECCHTGEECYKCEFQPSKQDRKGTVGCSLQMMKQALGLINRQKAEIERLNEENKRLLSMLFRKARGVSKVVKNIIKTEAIKEFAERLKKKGFADEYYEHESIVYVQDIDNLVREMVGEK